MKGTWKALAFLAAVAGVALALSTSAFAVGGGPGPAQAGSQWKTVLGPATWSGRLTALYPGTAKDTELIPFTVSNTGHAKQRLSRIVASVPAAGGGDAQTAAGGAIRGCRAGWFTVVVDRADRQLPLELAPGASYRGKVELTMRDSATNQNACRGASPAIAVAAH
jgi:hypothetical protein